MELRDDDRIDLGATGARPMLTCGGTDRFRLEAPPVGNLTDVRLWHDSSSDRPSWCARQTALARTGMALAELCARPMCVCLGVCACAWALLWAWVVCVCVCVER